MTLMPLLIRVCLAASVGEVPLQNGDVVLQSSRSVMSDPIRHATHSPYSHVGIVEVTNEGVFVIEAIQPVSRTKWETWKQRGRRGRVTVRRSQLDDAARAKVVAEAKAMLGKKYDVRYEWDDDRIYCSELVTKAFERGAQLTVGEPQRLDSLDLTEKDHSLAKRLGVSLEQTVVTPASVAVSPSLTTVYSDFD